MLLVTPAGQDYFERLAEGFRRNLASQRSNRWQPPSWAERYRGNVLSRLRRARQRRGSLVVPDTGEVYFLKCMLYQNPADLSLKLYKTNVTPAEADTPSTYTVADFTGYSTKTLTASQSGGTWAVPTTSGGTSSTAYAQQSWTLSGTSQTIYGYYVVISTTLLIAELFATARTLGDTDVLNLTPQLQAA
jgi:hypothetical protein